MVSRKSLVWVNRLLWTAIVGAVLMFGAVVSLGRHYLPYIGDYQQRLVDELNQRSGLQFSVGRIAGEWRRLSPTLTVEDLRLYNPANPGEVVLSVRSARLRLGLLRSLHMGTLAISQLDAQGVHVLLDEAGLGEWRLRGFGGGDGRNADALLNMLMAAHRAQLRDGEVDLHFYGGGAAHLNAGSLQLQRAGDFRRLQLALDFGAAGKPLTLTVEATGDPRDDHFAARGYAAFSGADLTAVLPAARAFGFDLEHGRIDGAAWLDWRGDGSFEVRGHVAMPVLDLGGLSGRDLPDITGISSEFLLRDSGGRRQLWLPAVAGHWGGVDLTLQQILISADNARPGTFQVALPALELAPLRDALLANKELLPAAAQEALEDLAPAGSLRNIVVTLPLTPEHRDALRLRAELAAVSVSAWHGAPALSNANGYVDTGARAGTVDLAGTDFGMAFPHVYKEALQFDRVGGRIGWRLEDERVLVNSGPLRVEGDAGRATALLELDLPTHGHTPSPRMTLMVGLRDSAAQYRDRFIPYTLKPELLTWLQRAIGGGRLPMGGFIYHGSLVGVEHDEHTVQLYLDVREGSLAYHPDWPPLRDLRAAVWLDDTHLSVTSPGARVFDNIATGAVQVEMHPLPAGGEWLTVAGTASGRDGDILRLLRETPLHKQTGAALDHWRWRGGASAVLDLGIPIGAKRAQDLRVDAELDGGELTLGDQALTFTGVRGPLRYRSGSGLQSSGIAAAWRGKPLAVKVATAADGELSIDGSGRVAVTDLQDWLQQPLLGVAATGETTFALALRLGRGGNELRATSSLEGVAINLPAPYTKTAQQPLPFTLTMPLSAQRIAEFSLGDWADLRLQSADGELQGATLRFGRVGTNAIVQGSFTATGVVPALDLGAWRTLVEEHGQPLTAPPAAEALRVRVQALQLPEVTLGSQTLRDVQLSGQRRADGWNLWVRADRLAGDITLPASSGRPWQVRLDYLRLAAPVADADAPSALASIDPARTAAVDVRIEHLWRGAEDWGRVEFELRPVAQGLRLDNLSGELRGIRIEARGDQPASLSWLRLPGGDRSEFAGRLAVADLGAVMQRWGYEQAIISKSGNLDAEVAWSGAPDAIARRNLDGGAELRIDDGRFLKASGSATGALKVVGIFNFANLLRRLQLDFSDLFRDGISFNRIEGGFAMRDGVVTIARPLEIESPSSRFRLLGQLDFNTDQTDMELVATLPVASNLPWVAALAGGLPAAAGVYVASKLFASQVDKFSSAMYDISGPWTDPEVKFRRIFDDSLQRRDKAAAKESKP